MNKQYMLLALRRRLKELQRRYVLACNNKDQQGIVISKGTAGVLRARIKRDMQLLCLIEQLLITSAAVYITDDDAIDGFNKLVEPAEKYKQPKNDVNRSS